VPSVPHIARVFWIPPLASAQVISRGRTYLPRFFNPPRLSPEITPPQLLLCFFIPTDPFTLSYVGSATPGSPLEFPRRTFHGYYSPLKDLITACFPPPSSTFYSRFAGLPPRLSFASLISSPAVSLAVYVASLPFVPFLVSGRSSFSFRFFENR